jgi:hypothetical protein
MRALFFIALILIGVLAWVNLSFLPSREQSAKEIIDRHIRTLPITDIEEIKYDGHIKINTQETWVDNLEIKAGYGKWDRTEYHGIVLYADRIEYDARALFWDRKREITSIEGLSFSGVMSFDAISKRMADHNANLIDPVIRYDGGHLYVNAYFSPLKSKFEFDGALSITPDGDLKYRVDKIRNSDGEDITSQKVVNMIEELSNLVIRINIMETRIAIDLLDVTESGVRIAGRSEKRELLD